MKSERLVSFLFNFLMMARGQPVGKCVCTHAQHTHVPEVVLQSLVQLPTFSSLGGESTFFTIIASEMKHSPRILRKDWQAA